MHLCVQRAYLTAESLHLKSESSASTARLHMCLSFGKSQLSCRETQLPSSPPSKITHSRNLAELVLPATEALTTRHATARHGPKHMTRESCLPTNNWPINVTLAVEIDALVCWFARLLGSTHHHFHFRLNFCHPCPCQYPRLLCLVPWPGTVPQYTRGTYIASSSPH